MRKLFDDEAEEGERQKSCGSLSVTCVAVQFITLVAAVRLPVALQGALDTAAIITLEQTRLTSRAT